MIIGIDAHKLSESVCVTDKNGNIMEEYKMDNTEENWTAFMNKYPKDDTEIAVESSTTGKYVAHLLRDNGFNIHLANPKKLKITFSSNKKTDKNDARNLAKLLRMGELPESYLPSKRVDELRSLVRYRRTLGEEITSIKNKVHALLAIHGISIDASDIFGKRSLSRILASSDKLPETDSVILTDLISRFNDISRRIEEMQNKLASMGKDIEEVKTLMSIPGVDYYTAVAIYSEIGDITRFEDAEHLSSYTGLVPRVDQSGSTAIYGHITKSGPSVLRYFVVNSVHTLIKLSPHIQDCIQEAQETYRKEQINNSHGKEACCCHIQHSCKEKGIRGGACIQDTEGEEAEEHGGQIRRYHEFKKEDMEKVIREVGIHEKSTKPLS